MTDSVLRVIPLGGLGEVGKNMTVFEIAGQILVIDAGLAFPRDEHLGVDLILPDFGYLEGREVLAVVLTHAHEDHVGALPYLLREVRVNEVWATRLTLGLIGSKLDEHGLQRSTELREIDPEGEPVDLGPFRVEFVRMAHSVPDAVGIAIETSAGRVFHTGDWKLDRTGAVIGRSMRKNLNIARNREYVHAPDDIIVRPVDLDDIPPERQLILC